MSSNMLFHLPLAVESSSLLVQVLVHICTNALIHHQHSAVTAVKRLQSFMLPCYHSITQPAHVQHCLHLYLDAEPTICCVNQMFFKSKIVCPHCGAHAVHFEPNFGIALPLPVQKLKDPIECLQLQDCFEVSSQCPVLQ